MKSFLTFLHDLFLVDTVTRQRRRAEEYLARSSDLADLERRQRELQRKGYLM